MNWFSAFSKVTDIADQAITDKDKLNELKYALETVRLQIYTKELETKTVPWVDALHKLGRQILSLVSMLICFWVVREQPDVSLDQLAAVVGPASIYNYVKGQGK